MIYLFLSHVLILGNRRLLLLKEKGWLLTHTVKEAALLKTADVSSRPQRRCIKATPPPGNKGSLHASLIPNVPLQHVALRGARALTRRFPLLVSILETELCTHVPPAAVEQTL